MFLHDHSSTDFLPMSWAEIKVDKKLRCPPPPSRARLQPLYTAFLHYHHAYRKCRMNVWSYRYLTVPWTVDRLCKAIIGMFLFNMKQTLLENSKESWGV